MRFDDEQLVEYLSEIRHKFQNEFFTNYCSLISSYQETFGESSIQKLRQKAAFLKSNVIVPLIERIGNSELKGRLLDEAISLDTANCVNRLRLPVYPR